MPWPIKLSIRLRRVALFSRHSATKSRPARRHSRPGRSHTSGASCARCSWASWSETQQTKCARRPTPGSRSDISFWCITAAGREKAEVAVVRYGVRIVRLDPPGIGWRPRAPGERDDECVLRCLRTLYQFATDVNCHVQVLAHPSKMEGSASWTAPTLEDSQAKPRSSVIQASWLMLSARARNSASRSASSIWPTTRSVTSYPSTNS